MLIWNMLLHTFKINQTKPPNCAWLSLWLLFWTHALLILDFFMFVSQILLFSLIRWLFALDYFLKESGNLKCVIKKKVPENFCPFSVFDRVNTTTTTTTKVKSSLFLLTLVLIQLITFACFTLSISLSLFVFRFAHSLAHSLACLLSVYRFWIGYFSTGMKHTTKRETLSSLYLC